MPSNSQVEISIFMPKDAMKDVMRMYINSLRKYPIYNMDKSIDQSYDVPKKLPMVVFDEFDYGGIIEYFINDKIPTIKDIEDKINKLEFRFDNPKSVFNLGSNKIIIQEDLK